MTRPIRNSSEFKIIKVGKLSKSSYVETDNNTQNANDDNDNEMNIVPAVNYAADENLEIWSCVFSADQSHLAWSCGYGVIRIAKWREVECCRKRSNEFCTNSLSAVQENKLVEIETGLKVWSLAFGSSSPTVKSCTNKRNTDTYRLLNFQQNTVILAAGLSNGHIRIYDAYTGNMLIFLFDHTELVRGLKFSKDGLLRLASASKDTTVKLWNMLDDGNMYKTLKGHSAMVYACDWSPTDQLLCTVGAMRQAFVWNVRTFEIVHRLKGHLNDVVTCEFSPDGRLLATGSWDTRICLWNPYTGDLVRSLCHLIPEPGFIFAGGQNDSYVRSLSFSQHGDHLISVCDDGKIRLWCLDAKSTQTPVCEETHRDALTCCYSSKSRTLIVGNRHGYLENFLITAKIPKLVELCRQVVNKHIAKRNEINGSLMWLPNELISFLHYKNLNTKVKSPRTCFSYLC